MNGELSLQEFNLSTSTTGGAAGTSKNKHHSRNNLDVQSNRTATATMMMN